MSGNKRKNSDNDESGSESKKLKRAKRLQTYQNSK